jgi:hypothetical protein
VKILTKTHPHTSSSLVTSPVLVPDESIYNFSLIYQVLDGIQTVKVIRMWTYYE